MKKKQFDNLECRLISIKGNTVGINNLTLGTNVILVIGFLALVTLAIIISSQLNALQPIEVEEDTEKDFITKGYVDRKSERNLLVNGESYRFCKSTIDLIMPRDYVKIIKEETAFSCGKVELIAIRS